jgi:hypothetical protein
VFVLEVPLMTKTMHFERPIPWLCELAAELENESVDGLYRDAGAVSRALSGAADLFDLPVVCTSFDTTLEAEAVGCEIPDDRGRKTGVKSSGIVNTIDDAFSIDIGTVTDSGRIPVMVDATERLENTCDALVLAGTAGPAVLGEYLLADPEGASMEVREEVAFTAGELAAELANAYLEAGADGIGLLEPAGLEAPMYREATEPIVNTLNHYEANGAVITEHASESDIEVAGELGFDLITGAVDSPARAVETAADADIQLGVGVPRGAFASGDDDVAAFCDDLGDEVLLSSEWTVPSGTDPEAVQSLMSR